MKTIILNKLKITKNYLSFLALVDDEDYSGLNKYNWYYTSKGYVAGYVNKKLVLMHHK